MSNDSFFEESTDRFLSKLFDRLRSDLCLPQKEKQTYLEEHVQSVWAAVCIEDCRDKISKYSDHIEFSWSHLKNVREVLRDMPSSPLISIFGVIWDEGVHSMSSELDDLVLSVTEFLCDERQLVAVFCTYNAGYCWLLNDVTESQWFMHDGPRNQVFGTWPQAVEKLSSTGRFIAPVESMHAENPSIL